MSESLGKLCIVLHAHLPYVLHHGVTPHGEAWLFEAAAEAYLPLLDLIGELALHKCRPGFTVGLTPVLLEQLAHPWFKEQFPKYLAEQHARAARDRADFERAGQQQFAHLAERWESWFQRKAAHFERIKRDIPAEFAARSREGHIQILTGPATHPYLPLLRNDEMIRANWPSALRRAGVFSVRRSALECGFRSALIARAVRIGCRRCWMIARDLAKASKL